MRQLFVFAIVFITIQSCNREPSSQELIDRFYSNGIFLDSLATILEADRHLESLFMIGADKGIPDIENSYPEVYKLLKNLDIADAFSLVRICRKCPPSYHLKTNWSNKYPIWLSYNGKEMNEDSTDNSNSFYEKDEYNNETWRFDNNWTMVRVVKLLEPGCSHPGEVR